MMVHQKVRDLAPLLVLQGVQRGFGQSATIQSGRRQPVLAYWEGIRIAN